MPKIIQCVPNFSEGKEQQKVNQIVEEILKIEGVKLVDYSMDGDHNRSVVTFVGEPEAVIEAAFQATKKAAEIIDLTKHQGEHPRMGATDVIPLIPLTDVSMQECVDLSLRLGERIGNELGIPVFMYEQSASAPHRLNLAVVRKGQYEGMTEKLLDPLWKPDFGPSTLNTKAGVTAVGARGPLIAFNVNLDTNDLTIAKRISRVVRGSSGGFAYCKALGIELKERNIVQVSMNLVDYTKTTLFHVFDVIEREAKRDGVNVIGSEIVGTVPLQALIDTAEYYLKLENFDKKQIIDSKYNE